MSAARSPDTTSPIYPDRAIRPLPKSRLKSKLSPEQASSITYPPDPPPISPTLSFSIQEHEGPIQLPRLTNGDAHHLHHQGRHAAHNHCTCGEDGDSGDDEVEFDHPDFRYSTEPAANGTSVKPVDSVQRRLIEAARISAKPPPPGSTASSADGYESFENTSNKKKRKIPLSGASSMHQSQLSAEMASMGISNGPNDGLVDDLAVGTASGAPQQQYSPQANISTGTGISGAGRGRYGRHEARVRRPLGSSTMNAINGYHSRVPSRDIKNSVPDSGIENSGGIISQAIRTAAEQGPLTPPGKGRENVSLLQSAATASSTTTPKTQFTFTCESDSASKLVNEQSVAAAAAYAVGTPTPARNTLPGARGVNNQSTQTTPNLRNGSMSGHERRPPPPPSNMGPPPAGQQQSAGPPPKPKPRRNPSKEYALQALNRKKQQQYQNYHNRPKLEDLWVCEFCEYEEIFGEPAYALIRSYEIKDRQERKKAAERRRLLEKAKMKGRKNKKGASKANKNNSANNVSTASANQPQNYDPNLPPPEGEEYYDDDEEYGDEYEPIGPDDHYPHGYGYPPPAPATVTAGGGTRAVG